jgi:hypothetical protein
MQPALGAPGDLDDSGVLAVLSSRERVTDRGVGPVVVGGFDEQSSRVRRSGLGERALPALVGRGVLGGNDPEKARQLLGAEPSPVADLGAQPRRRQRVDAPTAAQRRDRRRVAAVGDGLLERGDQRRSARDEHLDAREVVDQRCPRAEIFEAQRPQPAHVRSRPGRCRARPAHVAAQQHPREPVSGAHQIAAAALDRADEIAEPLIGRPDGTNANESCPLTRGEQELPGVRVVVVADRRPRPVDPCQPGLSGRARAGGPAAESATTLGDGAAACEVLPLRFTAKGPPGRGWADDRRKPPGSSRPIIATDGRFDIKRQIAVPASGRSPRARRMRSLPPGTAPSGGHAGAAGAT